MEELLMSRPKTPFFSITLFLPSTPLSGRSRVFLPFTTSRWSEHGGRGAEGKGGSGNEEWIESVNESSKNFEDAASAMRLNFAKGNWRLRNFYF